MSDNLEVETYQTQNASFKYRAQIAETEDRWQRVTESESLLKSPINESAECLEAPLSISRWLKLISI